MRSSHAILLAVALSLGAVATSAAAASQSDTCVSQGAAADLVRGCIEEDRSGDSSDPGCSEEGNGYNGENSAWMDAFVGNRIVGAGAHGGHSCQHSAWKDYERNDVTTFAYLCGEDDCHALYVQWYEAGDHGSEECDLRVSVDTPEAGMIVEASQVTPEGQDGCPVGPPTPGWGSLIPKRVAIDLAD